MGDLGGGSPLRARRAERKVAGAQRVRLAFVERPAPEVVEKSAPEFGRGPPSEFVPAQGPAPEFVGRPARPSP